MYQSFWGSRILLINWNTPPNVKIIEFWLQNTTNVDIPRLTDQYTSIPAGDMLFIHIQTLPDGDPCHTYVVEARHTPVHRMMLVKCPEPHQQVTLRSTSAPHHQYMSYGPEHLYPPVFICWESIGNGPPIRFWAVHLRSGWFWSDWPKSARFPWSDLLDRMGSGAWNQNLAISVWLEALNESFLHKRTCGLVPFSGPNLAGSVEGYSML